MWLDTAELKRSAAQSLRVNSKAPLRVLGRKNSSAALTRTRGSQLRPKQTTISSFFSTRTDEKDKENSRPPPFIPNKDCKGKGISLAAAPVKILALPQMEAAQHQPPFRSEAGTVLVTAQRHAREDPFTDSHMETHSRSEASCGAGEGRCCFSLSCGSEGSQLIPHTHKAQLLAGEAVSASSSRTNKPEGREPPEEAKAGLVFHPRLGAKQSKKPREGSSVNSLIDFTETITPSGMSCSTGAAGFHSSPQRPGRAWPLRERSQNTGAASAEAGWDSPCRELFTQDSEGNRVIAHWEVPSPCRQLPPSPPKGCSSSAAGWSWSGWGEQEPELCYELLFTQDSEGGRVIKH